MPKRAPRAAAAASPGVGRLILRTVAALVALLFGSVVYAYLTLPDVRPLRTSNPPTTAFMELRAREARARGAPARRTQQWVAFSRISAHLQRAVLVSEDDAFWQHEGIDVEPNAGIT